VQARANSQAFPQNRSEPCDFGYFKCRFSKTRSACYEFFTGDQLDIGRQLVARTALDGRRLRISVEWRQRVAGTTAPASGAVVILGADF
jgi:hypothetical protein